MADKDIKRYIDKKGLRAKIPLSDRTIDISEKAGNFPKRFTLASRKVVWDEAEINAWMQKQKEAGAQAGIPQSRSSGGKNRPAVNHV